MRERVRAKEGPGWSGVEEDEGGSASEEGYRWSTMDKAEGGSASEGASEVE